MCGFPPTGGTSWPRQRVSRLRRDSGQLVGEPIQAKSRIWRLALSPDGRLLATADSYAVRVWELATRREFRLAVPDTNGYDVEIHAGRPHSDCLRAEGVLLFHLPSGKIVGRFSDDDSSGTGPSCHRTAAGWRRPTARGLRLLSGTWPIG